MGKKEVYLRWLGPLHHQSPTRDDAIGNDGEGHPHVGGEKLERD
jgi:hypothetical protein